MHGLVPWDTAFSRGQGHRECTQASLLLHIRRLTWTEACVLQNFRYGKLTRRKTLLSPLPHILLCGILLTPFHEANWNRNSQIKWTLDPHDSLTTVARESFRSRDHGSTHVRKCTIAPSILSANQIYRHISGGKLTWRVYSREGPYISTIVWLLQWQKKKKEIICCNSTYLEFQNEDLWFGVYFLSHFKSSRGFCLFALFVFACFAFCLGDIRITRESPKQPLRNHILAY